VFSRPLPGVDFPFTTPRLKFTVMKRILILLAALGLAGGLALAPAARAQLALPGAASDDSQAAPAKAAEVKKRPRPPKRPPGSASIVDRSLRLNGSGGELRVSGGGKDKPLRIEKLTLLGEVISDPNQKCQIDIVAQTPIEAQSQGAPDGLERYAADIPACPLTFDVLDGAALVPGQTTACVFQAADCQAIPSGLWGPDAATIEKDNKTVSKARSGAEASIATSLRVLQKRDKGADAAALTREQSDFASQRDDVCRDYSGESEYGFCAARLTQARAALLRKRAEPVKRKAEDADN